MFKRQRCDLLMLAAAPIDLEQRINRCRSQHQQVAPLPFEHKDLLALAAYVAHQSKGQPISVTDDARSRPFIEGGREIFKLRQGQLNLSCAQCHDDNWGNHLGGAPIPQGHPTGYPIYRLEWQALCSLRRRLRNCLIGMRAETYPDDAPEIIALEFYLAGAPADWRWKPRQYVPETSTASLPLGTSSRAGFATLGYRSTTQFDRLAKKPAYGGT